ncbi:MAG: 4Fe-4S single cluster domain-containing protein [Polyangiales bacterium]
MTELSLAMMIPRTEAEGPGLRMALWVQGCPMRCAGCCNPEMLPFERGPGASTRRVTELLESLRGLDVEGVSLLGGEPFAHDAPLAELAEGARALGRSVMVFSGYTLEELRASPRPDTARLLAATDLLVDGRYEASRQSTSRRWIGSDNQRLHLLTDRYRADDPRFTAPNQVELRLRGDALTVSGWPLFGARRLVKRGEPSP